MRKLALMLLLAVAGNSWAVEWAEWVVIDSRETFTIYADTATIRKTGNMAQMWDLSDSKTGKALGGVKQSLSFKMEREYDCNNPRLRVLYLSWHSENMGAGAITGSDSNAGSWRPVMPGTIGERLWNTACKN